MKALLGMWMLFCGSLWGCGVSPEDVAGMRCLNDQDCVFENVYVCNSVTHTCLAPMDQGQMVCASTHDCRPGLVCDQARGQCILLASLGLYERCADTLSCNPGLSCIADDQAESGSRRTAIGRCLGDIGTPCDDDSGCAMAKGLWCLSARADEAEGVVAGGICAFPASDAGSACDGDRDCAAPMICQLGKCYLPLGEPCVDDGTCGPGTVCKLCDGTLCCGRPSGLLEICLKGSDCGQPLVCEGVCRAPLGGLCAGDLSCAKGLVCRPDDVHALRCQLPGPPGCSCDSSGDCAQGACSFTAGRCPGLSGASCATEAECIAPLVCIPTGNSRGCGPLAASCGACDTDSDCADGALCRSGLCQAKRGGNCTEDACCPSGTYCVSSAGSAPTCRAPATLPGEPCASDDHCADYLTCFQNVCRYPIGGGPCKKDEQCEGVPQVCYVEKCITPGGVDKPCGLPDGSYHPLACTPDLVCGAEGQCIARHSVDPGGSCRIELLDQDCVAGLRCVSGACQM